MSKKKRIVIIGSDGFIGSSILKNKKFKNSFKLIGLNKKKFNLLKISNCIKAKKIIKNNDCVIFCAGKVPVKKLKDFDINMRMFFNFLNYFDLRKFRQLVYISSDAVYADTKNLINEKSLTEPSSLHGLLHITREKILTNLYKNILILRPTLIYGSNDPHNGYGPNQFIRSAKTTNKITLIGKGEEKRDHINIDRVIEFILLGIQKKFFGIYNIASGQTVSFYQLAKHIIKIYKKDTKLIFKKRIGPLHHLGLRRFSIKTVKKNSLSITKIINKKFIDRFI